MRFFAALVLWCLLLVLCWPLAIGLFFIIPLVWLFLLPFRIIGFTLAAAFKLVGAILTLPFRIMGL